MRTMKILGIVKPLYELILTRVNNKTIGAIKEIWIDNTFQAWVKIGQTKQLKKDLVHLREIWSVLDINNVYCI